MNLDAMIHHLRGVLCELEAERAKTQAQQAPPPNAPPPPEPVADALSKIRTFGNQPTLHTGASHGSEEVSAA